MTSYLDVPVSDFTIPYSDENTYLALVNHVIENGTKKQDRTNTGTRSIFGAKLRFDLSKGVLPAITTKYINIAAPKIEMDWMLSGDTNIKVLQNKGIRIWDDWVDKGEIPSSLCPLHLVDNKKLPHEEAIFKITPKDVNLTEESLSEYFDEKVKDIHDQITAQDTCDLFVDHLSHTLFILSKELKLDAHKYKLLPYVEKVYYGLSEELQDPAVFIKMFYDLPNRKVYRMRYLQLTSIYHGEQVLTLDNALLVNKSEIGAWIDSDENGYLEETLDLGMGGCKSTRYMFRSNMASDAVLENVYVVRDNKLLRHMCSKGDLGPIYGASWRKWDGHLDQLYDLIKDIKTDPDSRRHLLMAWNPTKVNTMGLPPCHSLVQFYVEGNKLNLQVYFRSNDLGLGLPYNILNYSYMLITIATKIGMTPGDILFAIGDAHVYENHVEGLQKQLERTPNGFPTYEVISFDDRGNNGVGKVELDVIGYKSSSAIRLKVAV